MKMTNNKITIDEVADMLGASKIPPEIDYRIKECATKGTVGILWGRTWTLFSFGGMGAAVERSAGITCLEK